MDPARRPSRYFVCCLLLNRDRSGYAQTSAHDRGGNRRDRDVHEEHIARGVGPEYGTGAPEATASFMKVVEPRVPVHVCVHKDQIASVWIAGDLDRLRSWNRRNHHTAAA